jgi:diguanylate cyclase
MPIEATDPARAPLLLLGTLRLADNELLTRLAGTGQDSTGLTQTVIVDAGGVVLAHPDPGWLMKPAETVPGLEAAMQRWVQAGRSVEPLPDARQDGDQVVAQAGVAGADWMVFRLTPVDRLLGGVRQALRDAFAYGAAVAVLACAFLWFWLARLLRPLDRRACRSRSAGPTRRARSARSSACCAAHCASSAAPRSTTRCCSTSCARS